jgi:hypothetical protein
MDEKRRAKVEQAAAGLLEPGERVEAEVAGIDRENMWLYMIAVGPVGLAAFRRWRDYIATDRTVYCCQTGLMGLPKRVIAKRPLADARIELTKTGLAMDGGNELFVGKAARRKAREFHERLQGLIAAQTDAARAPTQAAGHPVETPAEPTDTAPAV